MSRTKGSWSGTDMKPILYPYYQYETITIRGREKYMLGEQIKRCREKRGFTQEQLAEKIGVSIETISSIERGIKMPRLQNFVAIAISLAFQQMNFCRTNWISALSRKRTLFPKSWRSCRGQIGSGF